MKSNRMIQNSILTLEAISRTRMRIQWQTGYSYNIDKELLTAGRR